MTPYYCKWHYNHAYRLSPTQVSVFHKEFQVPVTKGYVFHASNLFKSMQWIFKITIILELNSVNYSGIQTKLPCSYFLVLQIHGNLDHIVWNIRGSLGHKITEYSTSTEQILVSNSIPTSFLSSII